MTIDTDVDMIAIKEGTTKVAFTGEEIILHLKRGGNQASEAYEALYQRYASPLKKYVFGYVRDGEEAKDITHIVLGEKLLQNLDSLIASAEEGRLHLNGWLYCVARNLALNHVRNRKKRRTDYTDNIVKVASYAQIDYEDHISKRVFENETKEYLNKRLGELTEDHRRILVLRYRDDLSYIEISEKLKIKLGTVMSRLSRARESLQQTIQEAEKTKSEYQPFARELLRAFEG